MIPTRILALFMVLIVGCGAPPASSPPTTTAGPNQPFDPVGHWKLAHTDGTLFYITLKPDGSGRSSWGAGSDGKWRFDGERLVCTWEDGWTDIISQDGDGFKKVAYKPGRKPEGKPDNETKAEKVDTLPPKIDIR